MSIAMHRGSRDSCVEDPLPLLQRGISRTGLTSFQIFFPVLAPFRETLRMDSVFRLNGIAPVSFYSRSQSQGFFTSSLPRFILPGITEGISSPLPHTFGVPVEE